MDTFREELDKHGKQEICEVGEEKTGAQIISCEEGIEDYEEEMATEEPDKAFRGNDAECDY